MYFDLELLGVRVKGDWSPEDELRIDSIEVYDAAEAMGDLDTTDVQEIKAKFERDSDSLLVRELTREWDRRHAPDPDEQYDLRATEAMEWRMMR